MEFSERDVQIIDGAIDVNEQRQIVEQFKSAVWRFGWPRNDAVFSRPCWHIFIAGSRRPEGQSCEEELRDSTEWGFLAPIWARVKRTFLPEATLLGVYANGQTLGQDSPIHRDNKPGEVGTTVIMFCNGYWASCWGGELVFYNNSKADVVKAVLPKPGRVVLFNGHMPHGAHAPSIMCDQLRVTVAFKTIL